MRNNLYKKIAIGTTQFGMKYGIANKNGQVKKDEVSQILDFAQRQGINTIDTAKVYGSSEETIGNYINDYHDTYWEIITKVNKEGEDIEAQIDDSIDKLNTAPYAVLAHSASDYLDPVFCKELHQLKNTKEIQKIGVSVYTIKEIKKVLSIKPPDIIQCPLNILDNKLYRKNILDEIKGHGIDIHIRSVFLQGLFYLSKEDIKISFPDALRTLEQLRSISQNAGITLSELSLLWVSSLDQVDKVIIGVENVDQLKAHIKTLNKEVDHIIFEESLSINYENESILNPSLWT